MEELGLSFDEYWGTDSNQWKDINVYGTMMTIVARTANRVFCGVPLCMSTMLQMPQLHGHGLINLQAATRSTSKAPRCLHSQFFPLQS